MKPGMYIQDLLLQGAVTGKLILYLRHSNRDSFAGVPEHMRQDVPITPQGISMALEFGRFLQEIFPERRLILGHTAARRSRMTAECIARGFCPSWSRIIDYQEEIKDPIRDMDSYCYLRDENGWENLIIRWLNRQIPEHVMQDPDTYADIHVKKLLSFDGMDENSLFVVIGHDYTIFPIVSRIFGKKLTGIDFLNGIVFEANHNTAKVMFSDADSALEKLLNY